MMTVFSKPLLVLAMGSCLIASCNPSTPSTATPPEASPRPAFDTFVAPNVQIPVTATAGNCPDTVDLWAMSQGYEGGADHTVVVDFPAIALGPTDLLPAADQRVVYVAPLREEFAACVGTAESEALAMYVFYLENGSVHFTLNLEERDGTFDIRYADVSANRPYIYWRAAE
jgi:hypothetical protein